MSVESMVSRLRQQNAEILAISETAIDVVTGIMGYYGMALNAFDRAMSYLTGSGSSEKGPLEEIESLMTSLFGDLKEDLEATLAAEQSEGFLASLRDIDGYLAPIRADFKVLALAPPKQDPDPNAMPFNDYLTRAVAAIEGLSFPEKWKQIYYEPLYERPLESNIADPVDGAISPFTVVENGGTVIYSGTNFLWSVPKPGRETGDMIWGFTHILPAYLEAVLHLIVMIRVCDPEHRTKLSNLYRECADFLFETHARIEHDIRTLSMPEDCSDDRERSLFESWSLNGYPWGAVEPFSATTSIGCWTTKRPYGGSANELGPGSTMASEWRFIIGQEHAVRTVRRWRRVYAALGLPSVWKCINHLKRLSGEPELGPDHGTCSLRRLAIDAQTDYVRRKAIYGLSVPREDLSLRRLVNRLSLRGTVSMRRTVQM